MPLVYYRDSAYAPVLAGNAYATLEQIEPLLAFHAKWRYLDTPAKESAIINASAQLDLMSYKAETVNPAQAMKFPREFGETAGVFSYAGQDERLLEATAAQVEFNLNRVGVGMVTYQHGNEAFTPRQEMLCREAIFALEPFVRE
jgi:hypothetical protein